MYFNFKLKIDCPEYSIDFHGIILYKERFGLSVQIGKLQADSRKTLKPDKLWAIITKAHNSPLNCKAYETKG